MLGEEYSKQNPRYSVGIISLIESCTINILNLPVCCEQQAHTQLEQGKSRAKVGFLFTIHGADGSHHCTLLALPTLNTNINHQMFLK